MAVQKPNSFTSWEWRDDEEEMGAAILTLSNKMFIQNELSRLAQVRLNLDYDLKDPISFVQGEAELKGRISALQQMLDASDFGEKFMAEKAAARS